PAGTYTLSAWHALSKLKPEEASQSVQSGAQLAQVAFTLPLSPARPRQAMHGARAEPRGSAVTWWNRSSLRTKIFVAFSALILAVLLATLGLMQWAVSREAQATLGRELQTTGQVFQRFMRERAARLQTNSTLLASDFALKRVIATHFDPANYDPATLASAGLSYRQRLGVELVWMTDESGTLLAASPANSRVGQGIADLSPLREALQSEEAAVAVVQIDGNVFQLVAVPVFAPDVIGFLLLGYAIDDSVAAALKSDTGSEITFLTYARVFASTWSPQRRRLLVGTDLSRSLPAHAAQRPQASLVRMHG